MLQVAKREQSLAHLSHALPFFPFPVLMYTVVSHEKSSFLFFKLTKHEVSIIFQTEATHFHIL